MPDRTLADCTNDEMRALCDAGGPLACRWCERCDQHYRFCECATPIWRLRRDGQLEPMPSGVA